jgi:hypothetical protein
VARPRVAPGRPSALEARRDPPRRADPLRRSEELPTPSCHLFDASDRPNADSLQRRRSQATSTDSVSTPSAPQEADSGAALRRLQSLIIRGGGALDVQVSLAAGGGQGQPRPERRSEGQSPSSRGSAAPPSRRRVEVGQGAPSTLPSSKVRRAARRRNPRSAPRCEFSSSESLLRVLQFVLVANLVSSSLRHADTTSSASRL